MKKKSETEIVMYYSVSTRTPTRTCVGRVDGVFIPNKNNVPIFTLKDVGEPVVCSPVRKNEGDRTIGDSVLPNAIDPTFFEDGGKDYLVYGGGVVQIVELDSLKGTINFTPPSVKQQYLDMWSKVNAPDNNDQNFMTLSEDVTNWPEDVKKYLVYENPSDERTNVKTLIDQPDSGWVEAGYVYKHSNYYYIFANFGECCTENNEDVTYRIVYGRSTSGVMGPYNDKDGNPISDSSPLLLSRKQGKIIGPGHVGIFKYTDNTQTDRFIISFHYKS